MDSEFLLTILKIIVIPLIGALVPFVMQYLKLKAEQLDAITQTTLASEYLKEIELIVKKCVLATKQTYVDALKNNEKFDKAAQQQALAITVENIKILLSEESKRYIEIVATDLTNYLIQSIEAEVSKNK